MRELILPAIGALFIGLFIWSIWTSFTAPPEPSPSVLVILSNGVAVVPGYVDIGTCTAAGQKLREQVNEPALITACIEGPKAP